MLSNAILVVLAATAAPRVFAQVQTNATCSAESAWMANSKGQNPCLVSAYLSAVCNNGQWFVPALVGSGPYNPPGSTSATVCRCNTVVYSLLQACSVCQGGIVGTWPDWISLCPSQFVQKSYVNQVPADTQIPGWATIDPTPSGIWNATQARAAAIASPTPQSSGGKKSNVGAIVGGVVGGIAGLAIIGFLIWFLMQRSARGKGQKVTPGAYGDPGLGIDGEKDGVAGPGMVAPMHTGGLKPYDPSDPTTFPTSPAPTSTYAHTDIPPNTMYAQQGQYYDPNAVQGQPGYPPFQGGSPAPYQSGVPGPYQGGTPSPGPYGGGPGMGYPQQPQQPQRGAYTGAAEL